MEEGDRISIDIDNNRLDLLVSDEVLEERRKQWKPRKPQVTDGYLARYAAMAAPACRGAILELPV